MRYFYVLIFYFISRASLYLPYFTKRFFLYSNSISLVDVRTEYLLAVFTNRLYSWSKNLFLISTLQLIFLFVWFSQSPIYRFHQSQKTLKCLSWFSYISSNTRLFYIDILTAWRSNYFAMIFLIFWSISFAYMRDYVQSFFKQLFLNWASSLIKVRTQMDGQEGHSIKPRIAKT